MVANLAWLDELDVEGWVIVTAIVVAIGAAVWIFAGAIWLVVGASLYLALLVGVKFAVERGRKARERG